ncbi:MAG: hypothetical protein IJO91_09075 [Oscillospiraceae bacterium]|nr:hypothetical protein [Oscillospiraceae bacterium]
MDFFAIFYALLMFLYQLFFMPFFGYDRVEPDIPQQPRDYYSLDLSGSERPQVTLVELSGADNADIYNLYNVHVLHSGVVGLFGCPVEVSADEYEGASLAFRYDRDNMDLVPPENLIVLHYDEEDCFYNELRSVHSAEDGIVSVAITEGGVYMLADKYEWYRVWGYDMEQFAHDTVFRGEAADATFEMLVPAGVKYDIVSSYPQETEQGRTETLLIEGDDDEPFYIHAVLYEGEDVWQKEHNGWRELMYSPPEYHHITAEELTLENGSEAMLYRWIIDDQPRGIHGSASIIAQYKINDNAFVGVSYHVTDKTDEAALLDRGAEYLRTFRWTSGISEEAFVPAKDEEINVPPVTEPDPVSLVEYSYTKTEPNFSIRVPDNIVCYETNGFTYTDYDSGLENRSLMYGTQNNDIYLDVTCFSGENAWENRYLTYKSLFEYVGEYHTVEDISSTAQMMELYTVRYKDTGGMESNHEKIYLICFARVSDTEIVALRYDMWADAEEEYHELLRESLKSFVVY